MEFEENALDSRVRIEALLDELSRIDDHQLQEALIRHPFDLDGLLQLLKTSQTLSDFFQSPVGVWEGYTLEEHIRMVLRQYEKYFAGRWTSELATETGFRTMLVLHDIGKPLAVKENGDTKRQHEYTLHMLPHIFNKTALSEHERKVLMSIVSQDILGKFFRDLITLDDALNQIRTIAQSTGVSPRDYAQLMRMYYMCDAGSYTEDSGGLLSLDHLFVFEENSDGTRHMALAEKLNNKMDLLLTSLSE